MKQELRSKMNPGHKRHQSWKEEVEDSQGRGEPRERSNQDCLRSHHEKSRSTTKEQNRRREYYQSSTKFNSTRISDRKEIMESNQIDNWTMENQSHKGSKHWGYKAKEQQHNKEPWLQESRKPQPLRTPPKTTQGYAEVKPWNTTARLHEKQENHNIYNKELDGEVGLQNWATGIMRKGGGKVTKYGTAKLRNPGRNNKKCETTQRSG